MLNPQDIWNCWSQHWFDPDASLIYRRSIWLGWDKGFDRYVRKRLLNYTLLASENGLDHWVQEPEGALAVALLLDRVARKCFRGTCLTYEYDKKARNVSLKAVQQRLTHGLSAEQTAFLIFPLLASERLADQETARETLLIACQHAAFKSADQQRQQFLNDLLALAERNAMLLQKFRRFPHRAQALKHGLTDAEQQFVRDHAWQDWL